MAVKVKIGKVKNNMGFEDVICIIGFVVIIYFTCRPNPKKKKIKDTLTNEIHINGMPPADL